MAPFTVEMMDGCWWRYIGPEFTKGLVWRLIGVVAGEMFWVVGGWCKL